MDELTRGMHAQAQEDFAVKAPPQFDGLARAAVAAFQSHSEQSGAPLAPPASMSGLNGLAELAAHAQHPPVSRAASASASSGCSRREFCAFDDSGSINRSFTGADITPDRHSESEGILGRLAGAGTDMDPVLTLTAKQRLKARLHLEVLRVLRWCFHMMCEQHLILMHRTGTWSVTC